MKTHFTKMHGTGNDFIVIDDLSAELELSVAEVARLCDRHFGIGADGVILVRPAESRDALAFMDYRNADGSLARMCGNGVRCLAKFLVDAGFVTDSNSTFTVDTRAGQRTISFQTDGQGCLTEATVDMGEPRFEPELIPTTLEATRTVLVGSAEIGTGSQPGSAEFVLWDQAADTRESAAVIESPLLTTLGEMLFTCVSMGNPHAVAFLAGEQQALFTLDDGAFAALGAPLEKSAVFPEGCNIEFIRLLDGASEADGADLEMRVFERGVGETLACGTGACASAVAAIISGRVARRPLRLRLRGGLLIIDWRSDDNHVYLTGSAKSVFAGEINLPI